VFSVSFVVIFSFISSFLIRVFRVFRGYFFFSFFFFFIRVFRVFRGYFFFSFFRG